MTAQTTSNNPTTPNGDAHTRRGRRFCTRRVRYLKLLRVVGDGDSRSAHGANFIADPANKNVVFLGEHFCTACRGYVRRLAGTCFHCEPLDQVEAAE